MGFLGHFCSLTAQHTPTNHTPPPPTHTHTPFLHKLKMGHRCLQCPLLLSTYSSPYTYTDWRLDKHTAHANDNLKQVLWNWLLAASEKLWLVFSISQLGRSHQGSSKKRSTEQVCKNCLVLLLLGIWLVNLDEVFRLGRVTGDRATAVFLDVFVDAGKTENVSATKCFFVKLLPN